jgi:3-phosphoshikimate 1-carboxyvinyltransferase
MRYKITAPSHIDTTINLPASKSISNRALILHALGRGSVVPD